jgi:hypothetical protein
VTPFASSARTTCSERSGLAIQKQNGTVTVGEGCRGVGHAMTAEASVDNPKIEAICRECGNTLPAPELAEFFNEEQLILNFWSCSNCGFRFETEEKIRSEATSQIDKSDDEVSLFPETFFPTPRF